MIALVVISMFVVLLLGILVAGLLRSHADILRSLHELGLGVGDPAAPRRAPVPLPPSRRRRRSRCPHRPGRRLWARPRRSPASPRPVTRGPSA